MTVTQQARHQMIDRLVASLGDQAAATLMEYIPPVGWADVATKRDLDALEQRMDGRFAGTKRDLDALEQRMEARFARVDDRFTALEHRIDGSIDALRNELLAAFRGELVAAVSGQTRHVIVATATAVFGIGGLAVTLAQVLP